MAVYRSAHGKPVDMSALAAKNEKVRAVGNMNVNARGDVIDNNNRIIKDNTKRVKNNYSKTVGTTTHRPIPPKATPQKQTQESNDLSKHEKEMFDDLDNEDIEK